MGRRKGIEGSVREIPAGSGSWQARLPSRLDPYRRPLADTYPTKNQAWSALRERIVDMDRNAELRPTGRTSQKMRRVSEVLDDYINAREHSALAPIAIRTLRDYRSVLRNHVTRKKVNRPATPVRRGPDRAARRMGRLRPPLLQRTIHGLPVIRLHDARHTAATLLHTLYGLAPAVAASYLGHDTAVYLATYVHGEAAHDQVKDALARMQAGTA